MTDKNIFQPVKTTDCHDCLRTMVHEYWLLGYGHRQIGERLSWSPDVVNRALDSVPPSSCERNSATYVVCRSDLTESDPDFEIRCSNALKTVERRWLREHPDFANVVEQILDSVTIEYAREHGYLVVQFRYHDTLCGPTADLAHMIESDVVAQLREPL